MDFTTSEVSRITGASLRQLQHWDECGWIYVRMEGHSRRWSDSALRRAALFARVGMSGIGGILRRLAKLSNAVYSKRFFLFRAIEGKDRRGRPTGIAIPKSLIAATDDPAEVIRISTAAAHGVMLVEVPN